jgi:hypothetical protein
MFARSRKNTSVRWHMPGTACSSHGTPCGGGRCSHGTPCGGGALLACDVLEVEEVDGGHANRRRRQRGEIRATAAAT